jgi:hypothetical protein
VQLVIAAIAKEPLPGRASDCAVERQASIRARDSTVAPAETRLCGRHGPASILSRLISMTSLFYNIEWPRDRTRAPNIGGSMLQM